MGTRAVITVKDAENTFHIYKHWDGNPENILELLERARKLAWPAPRFEADEFAAAVVATLKDQPGDVRLVQGVKRPDLGQEYEYTVVLKGGKINVTAKAV